MIEKRNLGKGGPATGRLGYGAMGHAGYYGASDEKLGLDTINLALDEGMNLIDTADFYGFGENEGLVGRAVKQRRSEALIATKFGIVFDPNETTGTEVSTGWNFSFKISGHPSYVRKSLDASLKRLSVDTIDLWYAHYIDPGTPIEEIVGAMAQGVGAGKVRYLGLSNATAEEIRRAHAVHPISAVQYEYSLWRREAETELLPTLRELGIALVAWGPLGSGFLSGAQSALGEMDARQSNPRFAEANMAANRERFAPLMALAGEMGVTPSQLSLAWLLHQGDDIFPIPGTRRTERIIENGAAAAIKLDSATLKKIDALARPGLAQGATLL